MNKFYVLIALALLHFATVRAQQSTSIMTLDDVFSHADANSRSQKAHSFAIDAAREAVQAAKNERLPQVDASLSVSYMGNGLVTDRDFTDGMKAGIPHFGNSFALTASQIVYSGGAVSNGIRMAELAGRMAGKEKEQDRNNLRFMLAGYYTELYKLDNRMRVYDRNIALTEELIASAKAKYEEGTGLENDVTRYELQMETYKLERIRLRNARTIQNYKMNKLAGIDVNTTVIPDSAQLTKATEPSLPAGGMAVGKGADWHSKALTSAPSLSLAGMAVEQARLEEELIKSERRPKIALVAEEHLNGPITIDIPAINKNFNYWFVGIGATFNIASLYKNKSRRSKAAAQTMRRQEELQLVKDNIAIAVEEAYIEYMESIDELSTLRKNVQLAEQNYNTIFTRYDNGLALATDVIEVSNTLTDAGLRLANAYANVQFRLCKLKYTAGTL